MVWSQDLVLCSTERLTFDDVQLVPSYSEIESRTDVDLRAQLSRNFSIRFPVIAAPMETVCGRDMAVSLMELGACGAYHRFNPIINSAADISSIARSASWKVEANKQWPPVIGSIGATGDFQLRAEKLLEFDANVLLIDVAHGDHIHVKRALQWLNALPNRSKFDVIAGNVATAEGARRLETWGADAIRVGIGGGSMCETRIRTGVGVPQLHAIIECAGAVDIPVIADGGIRSSGDIAKALAAGAQTVMLGSLLAGTLETPGGIINIGHNVKVKKYHGSASAEQKRQSGVPVRHIEGASTTVEYKGPVENIITELMDGVRSAMSYVGARTLDEFRHKASFMKITNAGLTEAYPHGVRK